MRKRQNELGAEDVFTPSDFPTFTYIVRDEEHLIARLRQTLRERKQIVSVVGPSKTGKTVLLDNVVGRDNLVSVSGASIVSVESLWDRALDWLNEPHDISTASGSASGATIKGGASGTVGVPLLVGAKLETEGALSATDSTQTTERYERLGMSQVVAEIGGTDRVLFIDDFHYIARDVQVGVARQVKEAASRGVRICIASVPQRKDDIVRSNSELLGRVSSID